MKRLSIAGLGLMGASLGLAARKAGIAECVAGFARREETRKLALERGAVDLVEDSLEAVVAGAEIVVLCVPVLATSDLVRTSLPALAPGAVVTDVGSTKAMLVEEIESILSGSAASFVGSHPIAGSEEAGIEAARDDLYEGAVVVVTESDTTTAQALASVKSLWSASGADVVCMRPEAHDEILGLTSHLPHMVAAALADLVLGGADDVSRYCGTGFKDTTRIASGEAAMWHDIVKSNHKAISAHLERYVDSLRGLQAMIDGGNYDAVRSLLARARSLRDSI